MVGRRERGKAERRKAEGGREVGRGGREREMEVGRGGEGVREEGEGRRGLSKKKGGIWVRDILHTVTTYLGMTTKFKPCLQLSGTVEVIAFHTPEPVESEGKVSMKTSSVSDNGMHTISVLCSQG